MNSFYKKNIAIIGGGPAALFLYKHLTEKLPGSFRVDIFEKENDLGAGMPYSRQGANEEHIANVSANEIPALVTGVTDWIATQDENLLSQFDLNKESFHQYKVLPRLLLGIYLKDQFHVLINKANKRNVTTHLHFNSKVSDVSTKKVKDKITVEGNHSMLHSFDIVIICTGHNWPRENELKYNGYFDSPYPPNKLKLHANYPVALRGSSLTAIDAIRTLARQHGKFVHSSPHHLSYQCNESNPNFKIVMHSLDGLLPAIRFHLDDPQLSAKGLLTEKEIQDHRESNNGFVSLDYVFENDFKLVLKKKDPALYELVKEMNMEEFVEKVMSMRERINPFLLFKAEYDEALKSIKEKKSVQWKELLSLLSGALNYPAKYLSAEDMLRLKKTLLPLISIIIAAVPQSSCEELLALHEAVRLQMVAVDASSDVVPQQKGGVIYRYTDEAGNQQNDYYQLFIDCIGQPQLSIADFPFNSLVKERQVSQAYLAFQSAAAAKKLLVEGSKDVCTKNKQDYFMEVPGITVTDSFEIVSNEGQENNQIYLMAVPYMGGYNPDYSGLGFCNEAAEKIATNIYSVHQANPTNKSKKATVH